MQHTQNLNLNLFENEDYHLIQYFNENWNAIDDIIPSIEGAIVPYKKDVLLEKNKWEKEGEIYTYTISLKQEEEVAWVETAELIPSENITRDQMEACINACIATGTITNYQMTFRIKIKAFGEKPDIDIPITILTKEV